MSKHTPGPWIVVSKLSGSENHRGFRIADGANAWYFADVQPGDEDGELGRANAHLIAAAPDLLEALRSLTDAIYPDEATGVLRVRDGFDMQPIKAAIAKATGEQA